MNDAYLYDRAYFEGHYYHNDQRRDVMYRQEIERIRAMAPSGGRVLDIGCGVGNFLAMLDDRWEKFGFEPSEFAAKIAAGRNIKMLDAEDFSPEYFDLVVFRGTLQHMPNPVEVLSWAAACLKPGGLLAILATPDADSLVYKVFGNLPALDAPRNWIVMGTRSLRNILGRLGFEDIKTLHPYWSTPYARPLVDFANFCASLLFGYRKFAFLGNMFEMYAVKK